MSNRFPSCLVIALAITLALGACHHHAEPMSYGDSSHWKKPSKKDPKDPRSEGRSWTSFDPDRPAGSPAEVDLDTGASGPSRTTVELSIPGLWVEEMLGPDGQTYQKIEIPGLGSIDTIGEPDLPIVRFDVAIPTSAERARLEIEEARRARAGRLPGLAPGRAGARSLRR